MVDRSNKTILIVDDEQGVRQLISDVLRQAGYQCQTVENSTQCLDKMEKHNFDLAVIDLCLKNEDGLALAREIREGSEIPILMLTGKGSEADRILSLELAADDFLMKPFNIRELTARVNALLRRSQYNSSNSKATIQEQHECLMFDGWTLNLATRQLNNTRGEPVALTYGEYSILELLVKHPKRVMSREQILIGVKGLDAATYDRSIDVLISRLRNKLESNPKTPKYIRTERGVGYVFDEHVAVRQC